MYARIFSSTRAMRSRYALVTSTGEIFLPRRCSESAATSRSRISLEDIKAFPSNLLCVELCGLGEEVGITECGTDARKRQRAEVSREGEHRAGYIRDAMRIVLGDVVLENFARHLLDDVAGELCHRDTSQ